MSKSFKRIFSALFVILILIAAASLSGCDMEEEIVKEGLELSESDNSAVLPAMEASAYEAILPIITAYYEDTGERLSAEELSRKAERVAKITLSDKIGPTDHRLFIEAVKERAEELAPVLCGEEIIDHRSLGEIYIELTKNVSAEYVGEILYELTIFSYDEKIEKHLLVGDSVNNVLAARLTSEKATIENEVGEKNFSSIVSVVFIFRALFAGGEESGELFERFSEAELLILLKEIDLEEIKIGTAGYKILADYYCKSNAFEETSYAEELLYWANDNGDLMKLLENAEDFWRLVSKIKNSMTKDDVISLKNGDWKEFVTSILGRFEEEDFLILEKIGSHELNNDRYNKVARDYHEDFDEYLVSLEPIGIDELREGAKSDTAYNLLERYVYGISPAFSYGMNK